MGDENQLLYIIRYEKEFFGPYLEVGSRDYGAPQVLRSIFSDRDTYIGADMQNGSGVDVVLNFTQKFKEIDAKLKGIRFRTIFCMSVLEHCEQPFKMAENLTALLKPGGKICLSVPFSWKFHGFPSDYWRFTPEGVEKLFPKLEFDRANCLASTSRKREFYKPDSEVGKIKFSFKTQIKKGHFIRAISVKVLRGLSKVGILRWLAGYRYVLTPTMVNMIGVASSKRNS
ncbi:MAG: class I SAM-dependent methyltransferase [Thermodesulfobacteriota bacterium]|nr:class I SAM-dependent methyltransferase [Thermodesulfobacteriota bacterium]